MDICSQKVVWEMGFAHSCLWTWEQQPPASQASDTAKGWVINSLFPQANYYSHKYFHCSQQDYSRETSVTQGLCFHCLLRATPWPLTGTNSSASHIDGVQPLTLVQSKCGLRASLGPGYLTMGRCYPPSRHALVALSWGSHMGKIKQRSSMFFRSWHSEQLDITKGLDLLNIH